MQFFLNIIDTARCTHVILPNLFRIYSVLTDFVWRGRLILRTFRICLRPDNFITSVVIILGWTKNSVIDFLKKIRLKCNCVVAWCVRRQVMGQFLIGMTQIGNFDLKWMKLCTTVVCFGPLHIIIKYHSTQFYWQMSQISAKINHEEDPLRININMIRENTSPLEDPPVREVISQPALQQSQFLSQLTAPLHHRYVRLSNHSSNAANIFRNCIFSQVSNMVATLREYCSLMGENVFDIVPLTFIISQGLLDPLYNRLSAYFNQKKSKKKPNYWIMKPGEFSNRGNGIECTNKLEDIRKRISKCAKERKRGSIIIQEYIVKPLLYNGRKFDIRAYMMMAWHNGKTKAYWYQEGYIRTSSHFFTLQQMGDSYIHLTNDAVQEHSDTYGRFQQGNKLSYPKLQRYLDTLPANGRNLDFHQVILPQMRTIAATAIKSSWVSINPKRKDKNFELFGLDFMIDEHFKPWMIQMSSPVLDRIIPYMVQNLLRIALDPIFPPPDNFSNNFKYNIPENSLHYNKFQLIFDSDRDGPQLLQLYEGREIFRQLLGMQQDKNEYKQEGKLLNLQDV